MLISLACKEAVLFQCPLSEAPVYFDGDFYSLVPSPPANCGPPPSLNSPGIVVFVSQPSANNSDGVFVVAEGATASYSCEDYLPLVGNDTLTCEMTDEGLVWTPPVSPYCQCMYYYNVISTQLSYP